jgi:hypothetical protein
MSRKVIGVPILAIVSYTRSPAQRQNPVLAPYTLGKRRHRANPRAVKRKMSNYGVKRPEDRGRRVLPRPKIPVLSA